MSLFDSYRGPARAPRPDERVLRVTELSRLAKGALEAMGELWVEGEVHEAMKSTAGHVYFSLTDEGAAASVKCVMFRSDAVRCRVRFERGQRVRVRGRPTLYEARGTFQVVASVVLEAGEGDRARALAALKEKLAREGLFALERKRTLPASPRVIGVVTSTTGAALHDILRVSEGRAPVRIVVADCRVQGAEAPGSIVRALVALQRLPELEVVIVGRGGGSTEDLAAFDDEAVVRAIAACRVPIVSAVGHETDVTLADLAADVRAATPSNAAELVVPDARAQHVELDALRRRLEFALDARIDALRLRLERHGRALEDRDPRRALLASRRRFEALRARLSPPLTGRLAASRATLEALRARLVRAGAKLPERGRLALADRAARLSALSPLAVLGRGYAIARTPTGRVVRAAGDVSVGDPLTLMLAEGGLEVRVEARSPAPESEPTSTSRPRRGKRKSP